MSFEEEFDKIIRQKAEEAKYSFDEASWHKVSGMLEAERKVAGAFRYKNILLSLGGLVVLGVAGYLTYSAYLVPTTGTTLANNSPSSAEQLVSQKSAPAAVAPSSELAASETNIENASRKETPQPKEIVASQSASPLSNTPLTNPALAKKPATEAQTPATAVNQKPKLTAEAVSQQSGSGTTTNPEQNHPTELAALPAPEEKGLSPLKEENTESALKPEQEENQNAPAQLANVTQAEQVVSESLNPIWAMLPLSDTEAQLKEPFPYPVIKDEDYYNKGKLNRKHYLTAEAGAMYLFGWDREAVKDGKGLDFFAGLNYGRYINRQLSISFGLQIYNIANINKPYYSVSRKEYGFGSTTIYTVVTTNNLVFASVPLRINYALNNFNVLSLGANVGYLASANSVVETYYLRDNEKINLTQPQRSNRIYEGTQSLNLMLTAAYSVQLTNRWGLKAEYVMGLTDLFKNSGTINSVEKTSGLRVGIQYTLFDK